MVRPCEIARVARDQVRGLGVQRRRGLNGVFEVVPAQGKRLQQYIVVHRRRLH